MSKDDERFKTILTEVLQFIYEENNTRRTQPINTTDSQSDNPALNVNTNAVSCDPDDDEFIRNLTNRIGELFKQSLSTMTLIHNYREYILNSLYQYHYDRDHLRFKESLTVNNLEPFINDLQATHDSLDAYRAAWDGKVLIVKDFLEKYPAFRDKPGPWGTTFLYSAARNDRMPVVQYLLMDEECSINAQNQQHIERALGKEIITAEDYVPEPKAGSTALHGACYGGYLPIVRYLIEHGANYFIRNQAEETPINNAEGRPEIVQYFRNLLNRGYVKEESILPNKPITEMDTDEKKDCIWEYLPFNNKQWSIFEADESDRLNQSLLVQQNKPFQQEVQWDITHTISMVQFLRRSNQNENLAWIRCRGSSIRNFDCFPLWQLLFLKHPQAQSSTNVSMSMEVLDLSMANEGTSEIRLNTWYNCDARTNSLLDEAMNNHRKRISVTVTDLPIECDLVHFQLISQQNTISGFLRWLPKLISNNMPNQHQIVNIDNFQSLANLEPTPLTTKHLRSAANTASEHNRIVDNDDYGFANNFDQDNDFDDNEDQPHQTDAQVENQMRLVESVLMDDTLSTSALDDDNASVNIDTLKQVNDTQAVTSSEISEELQHHLTQLREENEKLENTLAEERLRIQTQADQIQQIQQKYEKDLVEKKRRIDALNTEKTGTEQEWLTIKAQMEEKYRQEVDAQAENLDIALKQVFDLNEQMETSQQREVHLNQLKEMIQTTKYKGIPIQTMHDFILPKFTCFNDHLRTSVDIRDEYFSQQVPKMEIKEQDGTYEITVCGFPEHHIEFKSTLKRLFDLSYAAQSSMEFYQRHLNRIVRSIHHTMIGVDNRTQSWRKFMQILNRLLQEKSVQYKCHFDDFIREKSKLLIIDAIRAVLTSISNKLRQHTNDYLQQHELLDEVEKLKNQTLEEFIKEYISSQSSKLEKKPREKSVQTVKSFIDQIKQKLRTNPDYIGHQLDHFKLIPYLLKQIVVYYSCFLVQLPLFEFSRDLLDIIDKNAVTTITTSTGSGKSTLLPPLLITEGYDKVIVTQPRRYPCSAVSKRVNQTIKTDINDGSKPLAGWAVSGDKHNADAEILYLTDGLLKESLMYDKDFINSHINVKKSVVFFIDEVHERSVNIDLCLALFARLLQTEPKIQSKIKLIISSATLDSSVPELFRHIPNVTLGEFQMAQIGLLYPVAKISRRKENVLDVVQELYTKRQRHDQILCFVNSVTEVRQCCRLLKELSRGTIIAYPLIQSQSAALQENYIEHGSVFFSTTVAETSLTFPSLRYVVDTGMINVPVYNSDLKRTVLEEVRAAESNIKQRLGRLGRTRDGEYYSLYDFRVEDQRYPVPHICQSDLTTIEFLLRRSLVAKGLFHMQTFLPDRPQQIAVSAAVEELRELGVVEPAPNNSFTQHGACLAKLPDFGSLAMSKAVLAALQENNCGGDLIRLSSILSVLNISSVLKDIPQNLKSADGDFMTLLNVMNELLLVKESSPAHQFNLKHVCREKGWTNIQHILGQALRRYSALEKLFNLSAIYRQKAQRCSRNWNLIAKSLLAGYADNVFVSMKELQERTHRFARYKNTKDIALLDLNSTLTRPISQAPVCVVLARDIRYSSAVRDTAILSFVGEIKPSWIRYRLKRQILVTNDEENHLKTGNFLSRIRSKLHHFITIALTDRTLVIDDEAGTVLNDELGLRKHLITTNNFDLENKCQIDTAEYTNLSRNLASVTKMIYIFQPMQWRWEAQKQMKITVNNNPAKKTCEITVEGRHGEHSNVKGEFDSFLWWLKRCAVIRHPNSGVLPRLLKPQMRKKYPEIEKRIALITDINRTSVDLYKDVKGRDATRETRMAVVAWIAVCEFNCKLEGGFVRDWVVGNHVSRPSKSANDPQAWIEYKPNFYGQQIPSLKKEVVPCDLDCHLPLGSYFDIEKFRDKLYKYNITCEVVREDWRYILLFDKNVPTGPFTMDLIEPHIVLTQDRIDLDVNNLSLERNYPREIGMRVDITQSPYSIELESIVENIMNRHFQVLRPIDTFVQERIDKMIKRHWTQHGEAMSYNPPPPPKCYHILVPIPTSSTLYQSLLQEMQKISNAIQIVSMEEVKNPLLEDTYEAMKKMIAKECPKSSPNERKLFHGTSAAGSEGIVETGFDDRFFAKGAWGKYRSESQISSKSKDNLENTLTDFYGCSHLGKGAYFAHDPRKSHNYASPSTPNNVRVMFYNKVILGNEDIRPQVDNDLVAAPKSFHSVRGTQFTYVEYIVYRYGQALPYLKITYRA